MLQRIFFSVNLIAFPRKKGRTKSYCFSFSGFTQDELIKESNMQHEQWEIVILKPTSGFLSFLKAQLPDVELPSLSSLQLDNTAYTIRKQTSEEATFDEIEHHYQAMFKHEITRWMGDCEFHEIEATFLDFLCCFKFELHSQIVLMEPSMDAGHQVLCVKPRVVSFKWNTNKEVAPSDFTCVFEHVDLSHLVDDATVLVKNFNTLSDLKPFIQHHYRPIFKAEMVRMGDRSDRWPKINSLKTFNRYFEIDPHSQLVHLH